MNNFVIHNFLDAILKNNFDGAETDVIYLDYAKAFDKVDHNILLKKLSIYGISGNLHKWLTQYLQNHQQIVIVDGQKSQPAPVISGVPHKVLCLGQYFLSFI